MISLNVTDAMTTPVQTVDAGMTATEAATEMRAERIGALVVTDDTGETIGIVTESDLLALVVDGKNMDETTVDDCCSAPVVTIDVGESTVDAGELMKEHSIRRVPVRDDGEMVGIVTTSDLAHYLPRLRSVIRRARPDAPATVDH